MTTINSTDLDFFNIKESLRDFLRQKEEFRDYDFQGSALNNILDVLAWNTHHNALIANFGLNESYLNTAQLRSSVVSLAEAIGYIPRSKTASKAVVNLTLDLGSATDLPLKFEINDYITFTGKKLNDSSRTFQTRETLTATYQGAGQYLITDNDGNENISIYEGRVKTKTFIADEQNSNAIYVLPDNSIDTSSMIVKVYPNKSTQDYTTYFNIKDISDINEDSRIYIVKEAPNGYYELIFGDDNTLGVAPSVGSVIEVEYINSNGEDGNGIELFKPTSTFTYSNIQYPYSAVTVSESVGGQEAELIRSIKKNAPYQYAAQNRMVTANDYTALILRNFGHLIEDITSYGGEDAKVPHFGFIYVSIKFLPAIEENTKLKELTLNQIKSLVDSFSIIAFDIKFVDPLKTFIKTSTYFEFNPKFTTLTLSKITSDVNNTIQTYFDNNTGKFKQSFRRSNILSEIDNVSPAVLSSRMDVEMMQEIPLFFDKSTNYNLEFPVPIMAPDDKNYSIYSDPFLIGTKSYRIRNRLNSNILEIYDIAEKIIYVDNTGYFEPASGKVFITSLFVSYNANSTLPLYAVPANQASISPVREEVIEFKSDVSFAQGQKVTTE